MLISWWYTIIKFYQQLIFITERRTKSYALNPIKHLNSGNFLL